MKGSNSSSSGVVVPRWYPDGTGGSASFTDVGCGLESGSAHCDFAELEACLVSRYTRSRALPPPRSLLGGGGGGARQYVTVLRSPLSRVRSEFAFACQTKRRTRRPDRLINTPHGPRALLDWSPRLWGSLDERTCAAPSAAAFRAWVEHPDNPAHGRFARYFLPHHEPLPVRDDDGAGAGAGAGARAGQQRRRTLLYSKTRPSKRQQEEREKRRERLGHELLFRAHNCLVGDHASLVDHWNAWLAPLLPTTATTKTMTAAPISSSSAPSSSLSSSSPPPQLLPLSELMSAVNGDARLWALAEGVLRERFWFVAVLERLPESYAAFCELGRYPRCGSMPPRNQGMEHSSSGSGGGSSSASQKKLLMTPELSALIRRRNALDIRLYNTAVNRLSGVSATFRKKSTDLLIKEQ
jgi:hypothetical protein